ncbi:hypothetical protein AVEN_66967-1 [Araneus ventricosus]|uniref:Uncharacterized protein n=1 Tax=Araneus ventricosus TaxID=182803 RepID=A0A4Y2SZW6_ARAVE|nr:hypothetical protein AVEN_257178-1 [Araneus ventricosus]GBN93192.1 hypothetical protein AVEN_66967-1 [Araneus ventricosus]
MDSSVPFPLFTSLRVVGDMNGRPFMSHLSLRVPLMTTRPTAFSPLSEQQLAEIRPSSIQVAWTVTAGLGVSVKKDAFSSAGELLQQPPVSAWKNEDLKSIPLLIGSASQAVDFWPGPDDLPTWTWNQYKKYVTTSLDSFGLQVSQMALRIYNGTALQSNSMYSAH